MVKSELMAQVQEKAERLAEDRLLDLLLPRRGGEPFSSGSLEQVAPDASREATLEKLRAQLRAGKLDERMVELETQTQAMPMVEILSGQGMEEMGIQLKDMLSNVLPTRTKRRRVRVAEARRLLAQEEAQKLVDMEEVVAQAIRRVQNSGIIFLDELDKIAGREGGHGPDVSREGVQRDLLPIVEGSSVTTKYGVVRTDHVLFIAAGAFHIAKPSDLIPELQGRFPIRVELEPLTREDFVRILTEPENALIRQYVELLRTEQVTLRFLPEAVEAIAEIAMQVNTSTENIGARRLYTIMERLLDEISFGAPDMPGKELIDRRRVRATAPERDHAQPGSLPVHPVSDARSPSRSRSCWRRSRTSGSSAASRSSSSTAARPWSTPTSRRRSRWTSSSCTWSASTRSSCTAAGRRSAPS